LGHRRAEPPFPPRQGERSGGGRPRERTWQLPQPSSSQDRVANTSQGQAPRQEQITSQQAGWLRATPSRVEPFPMTNFKDLPSQYDHAAAQARWYPLWEERRYFHANPQSSRPPFSIVIPP